MTLAVNIAQSGSNNQTMRNRIINGAMTIDQRNAGASVTPTNGQYTLDRWQGLLAQTSKYTVIQSSTAPTGFINSLLVTSSSAYSVGASDYFDITQYIEGLNMTDLAWGTANAQPVTLSFWVRSSLTGTFGGSLQNNGQTRSYPFSYTISSANTWEQKSVTIAGDTTGTWLTTNGRGIQLNFSLGTGATFSGTAGAWATANYLGTSGATSVVGTSGATFYITGVQLEEGTAASPFENRLYGTELSLCERYFQKCGAWNGAANNTTNWLGIASVRTAMRTTPSIGATGPLVISNFYSADPVQSSLSIAVLSSDTSTMSVCLWMFNFTSLTTGAYYAGSRAPGGVDTGNYLQLIAEL